MEATLQTHLPGSAHALLEGWRADQDKLRRREAKALTKVIAWLTTQVGTGPIDHDHLHDIPLGGQGCPELPETVVAEFACVASMNLTTARSYLADAWTSTGGSLNSMPASRLGRLSSGGPAKPQPLYATSQSRALTTLTTALPRSLRRSAPHGCASW